MGKILKSELLTKLNWLATAVLLWITNQPGAPIDKVLPFIPEAYVGLFTAIAPVIWAIIVQIAIGKLKNKQPDSPAVEADAAAAK